MNTAESLLDLSEFQSIFPQVRESQLHYDILTRYAYSIGNITTRMEMAMFLAQVSHETGQLEYATEHGCPEDSKCQNYQYPKWELKSCGKNLAMPCRKFPATPSTLYYGRGYLQLSWPINYDAASWALFGDDRLYRNPNLASSSIENNWKTALWYWKSITSWKSDIKRGHFGASTAAINGDLECKAKSPLAQQRFQRYLAIHSILHITGSPSGKGCV